MDGVVPVENVVSDRRGPEHWLMDNFPALHRGEYGDLDGIYMRWADLDLNFLNDRGSRNWGPMALAYRGRIHDDTKTWQAWVRFMEHELYGVLKNSEWSGEFGGYEFPSRLKWAWVLFSVHSVFQYLDSTRRSERFGGRDWVRARRQARRLTSVYLRAAYSFCALVALPWSFLKNRVGQRVREGATIQQAGPRSPNFTNRAQELDDVFCLGVGWKLWNYRRGRTDNAWIRDSVLAVGRADWERGWAAAWGRKQIRDFVRGASSGVGGVGAGPPARASRWVFEQLRAVKAWGGETHVVRLRNGALHCWWGGWNQYSRPVAHRESREQIEWDFPYDDLPLAEQPRRWKPLDLDVWSAAAEGKTWFKSRYEGPRDYRWDARWVLPHDRILYHVELDKEMFVWCGAPPKASFLRRAWDYVMAH